MGHTGYIVVGHICHCHIKLKAELLYNAHGHNNTVVYSTKVTDILNSFLRIISPALFKKLTDCYSEQGNSAPELFPCHKFAHIGLEIVFKSVAVSLERYSGRKI